MSNKDTAFATTYRRIVLPILTSESLQLAADVAHGQLTFAHAMATLHHTAYARGAAYLPETIRDDLHQHLAATLLHDIDLAEDAQSLVKTLLREPTRAEIRQRIRGFLNGC